MMIDFRTDRSVEMRQLQPDLAHLDWPFFEPRHRALTHDVRGWSAQTLPAFEQDEGRDGKTARRLHEQYGQAGFLAHLLVDSAKARIDLRAACLLREICGYSSVMADVALSEPWLGILPILLSGSAVLRERYLPAYRRGELLPAFALSEPGAGSDVAAITTTATRHGNSYLLNGRKTWTSNAGLADLYVVFARLDNEPGLAVFAVDADNPGIQFEQRVMVMSPHTVGTWSLSDCVVPASRMIGEPGQGYAIAMAALELFRPSVGAAALGFARRALDEALDRSIDRTTFKRPIAEHQLIQAKVADMVVGVDASALLVYRAAWAHDKKLDDVARAAAVAKLYSTESAFQAVDQALQIFGGMGVVSGTVVERLYRHVRAFRIFDGSSEIQRLIIAKGVIGARGNPH